jgi:hypothetical protein
MSYGVFISNASQDQAFSQELNDRLVNESFNVWFDKKQVVSMFLN